MNTLTRLRSVAWLALSGFYLLASVRAAPASAIVTGGSASMDVGTKITTNSSLGMHACDCNTSKNIVFPPTSGVPAADSADCPSCQTMVETTDPDGHPKTTTFSIGA